MEKYGEEEILKKSQDTLLLSLTDELKRNLSIIKIGKNIEELSDEEKNRLNELVHNIENSVNITNLVNHIIEGTELTTPEKMQLNN